MGSVSPSLPVFVVWVGRRAWWVTGQSLPPAPSPPSLLPIHLPAVQLRRRWRRPTRLPALAKGRHQGLFFVVAQRPGAGIRDCLSLVVQRPRACIRNCFLVVRRPWAGIRGWFFWSCKCHGQAWSCKDHGQALGFFCLVVLQPRRRWRRPTRLPALATGKHQGLFFCAPARHRQVKSLGLYNW